MISDEEDDHEEMDEEMMEDEHEMMDTAHIGRPPRCTFGQQWSPTAYISKLHSKASTGIGSPGVGDYKLSEDLVDYAHGAHFGTSTKDLLPTQYLGPAGNKGLVPQGSPGPKYNAMPTEYRAVPAWKIGTSKRPPLSNAPKGPGPGTYSGEKAPSTAPPEFSFGQSPDQDRFATNMYMGQLASKSIPVVDTPGAVYQIRTKFGSDFPGKPFDHADRFEPLKHMMISDEHNKRMGEKASESPAPNVYMTSTFPQAHVRAVRRNPPTLKGAKAGVYQSGENPRFTKTQFLGKAAQVGLGDAGGGPGSADVKDCTLKKNGPKFPRSKRDVGSKSSVSQVPGPGAYKPPLKVGGNYQGKGIAMGVNRPPKAQSSGVPAPNKYMIREEFAQGKPSGPIGKGPRSPKVYLSKKHTQDIKGIDSPGPVYHYQIDKDFGTGHQALIGTADRNKSEAKRFISKLHTADTMGVGTPGPGSYGGHEEGRYGQSGYSFGTSERKSGGGSSKRTPGPGQYVLGSTLKKVGASFGGGPSRC